MRGKWNGQGTVRTSGMTMSGRVGATRKVEKLDPALAAFLGPARKARKARPARAKARKARK